MAITLAFDIYGTLIDTQGITQQLARYVSDQAPAFALAWREKQLEYSFRRGLMRRYENFAVCTRNALDYTDLRMKTALNEADKQALMAAYRVLPAFDDVPDNLQRATDAGFKLFAFSNGSADAVENLLAHANIRGFFDGVVSVDSLQTFKPNPDVYQHFLRTSKSSADNAWLISSNPFDVQGAIAVGMRAAWLRRSPEAIFDPWGIEPTHIIESLAELPDLLA
jgi:2-haloacid dehalogenase